MTPVAEIENLSKRFGKIEAVCDLTFSVHEAEIFGLIGPNGSGKTTTLRTLLGFYRPDGGCVKLLGYNPRTAYSQVATSIGVILEQSGLCPKLTAGEYLEYYAGLLGIKHKEAKIARDAALEIVGLASRRNDLLGTFSKGMGQRMCLARCLLNKPRLLVLDEPFDGVDVESRKNIRQLLVQFSQNGIAVIVTSHNLDELERVCMRVAVIAAGRLVGLDSPKGFDTASDLNKTLVIVIGASPDPFLISDLFPSASYNPECQELTITLGNETQETVLSKLLAHHLPIKSMHEEGTSLEDTYMKLTTQETHA